VAAWLWVQAGLWQPCPKNAREYVPVGLGRAILGAPRFRTGPPEALSSFRASPIQ